MAIVGYARVSTIGQNLEVQIEKLRNGPMGRIIQTGIRPEPLCTNILNCFTMISDYTRLWVISHPWNMRKPKESLNTTVHQIQYTSIPPWLSGPSHAPHFVIPAELVPDPDRGAGIHIIIINRTPNDIPRGSPGQAQCSPIKACPRPDRGPGTGSVR